MDLLSEFWKSKNIIGGPSHLDISSLSEKVQWLETLGHKTLTFELAIKRLESFCLLKTRMNDQSRVTSALVHSTICKWRLETIDEQERQDYIMLAALVLSRSLPDIGMDAGAYLRQIPLIKYSYDLLQQYIAPRILEAFAGTSDKLCQQYTTVIARYTQAYTLSPYTKEAEAMLAAAVKYNKLLQGCSWPQDRESWLLLRQLASSFLKCEKFDNAIPILESLCKADPELFDDTDDIPVWAAARLRDVREREILYGRLQQRAIMATNKPKPPMGLDGASENEEFEGTAEDRSSIIEDSENPLSDEEYYLRQTVVENERLSGPSDNDTLQAISDLAQFYKKSGLYFKAGRSYEDLWHGCRSKYETRGPQALADTVDSYRQANRLTQRLELNFLEDSLTCAAMYGDEETVETLILAGAKINGTDVAGHTALYWAAFNHHDELVHRLLNANADTEVCNSNGYRALHAALLLIKSSSPKEYQLQTYRILRMLIERGANIHATNNYGDSVLCAAAQTGLTAAVQILLNEDVVWNEDRDTALEVASVEGHEDVVKLLLGSGIYDYAEGNYCVTALEGASQKGHLVIVQLLLASKADLFGDLERLSKVFLTPHLEVIQVLFTFFIDIQTPEDPKACAQRDFALQAVLCAILDTGIPLLLRQVCERGIDINQSTYPISLNATLLHNAARHGHVEPVKILIALGANANKLDDYGSSPLSLAAQSGNEDIVALLLPITKDVNTQDIEGNTALSLAAFFHGEIIKMLLKAGAQIVPQEPGPHSRLIPETQRISGYGSDAILTRCLRKRPIKHSSPVIESLTVLLEAAITGDRNLGLDVATATAEALSDPLPPESPTQAVSVSGPSDHHSITTYQEALKILCEEDWEAWEKWVLARAASAPQHREEVVKLKGLAKERDLERRNELSKVWDATLPLERAKKLKVMV